MVRIGIILTDPRHEAKGELFACSDLEWTKSVPKHFIVKQKKGLKYGKHGIQIDVAMGAYIQHVLKPKDMRVDFIMPKKVSKKRLESNDLNFIVKYGLVEAESFGKTLYSNMKGNYSNMKKSLHAAKNVYPPVDYQELVNSKISYYNYMKENDISILPTFAMAAKEYNELGHDGTMKKVFGFMGREGIGNVFAKPDLGMGGLDAKPFKATDKGRRELSTYFRKMMKKHPGIIVQKELKGFGDTKECPELRMFYIGDEYVYSVSSNANAVVSHPEAEGGTLEAPLKKLKAHTQKMMKKLPPIVMPNGARLPRLATRMDMGWRVEGRYQPFINEAEFSFSSYAEYKPIRQKFLDYISSAAKQMVNITGRYMKSRGALASRGKASRHVVKPHFQKRRRSSSKS